MAATRTPGENEEKRKQRAGKEQVKGEERNGARGEGGDLKGGKGRERENDPKTLSRLAFSGRRDDFRMIILSMVFRERYLLRAHKPTETLEKRPASTRLRSKEVTRGPPLLLPLLAVEAMTRLGQNEAMLSRSSISREKTRWFTAVNTCLHKPVRIN